MADLKKHCNSYGFLGFFTAICCAVAWFLVDSKGEECIRDFDKLQYFHVIGLVAGIVLLVCGFFDVAGSLKQIIIVFYIATVVIACLGGLMGYAAWYAFQRPCMPLLGFIPIGGGEKNIFKAEDGKMIGVFILDICSALMYLSAAGGFHRQA